MRVALYARVSTEEQAIHGLSIDAQLAALDEWAKDKTVIDHYIDLGISARKPITKRPELQRLLRDVEQNRVDLIAFCKLDRWTRNIREYYKAQDVLDAHNVAWRAIQEDYETETASGRLKVNLMLAIAQGSEDRRRPLRPIGGSRDRPPHLQDVHINSVLGGDGKKVRLFHSRHKEPPHE